MDLEMCEGIAEQLEAEWGELICSVVEEACRRFEECGAGDDFRLQYRNLRTIVFGGHNRVVWSASRGFYPDRGYCSDEFLELWDEKYDERKRTEELLETLRVYNHKMARLLDGEPVKEVERESESPVADRKKQYTCHVFWETDDLSVGLDMFISSHYISRERLRRYYSRDRGFDLTKDSITFVAEPSVENLDDWEARNFVDKESE